eukprot:SAG11_NODE_101_length_16738_cov_8.254703_7_plen_37_part_00
MVRIVVRPMYFYGVFQETALLRYGLRILTLYIRYLY